MLQQLRYFLKRIMPHDVFHDPAPRRHAVFAAAGAELHEQSGHLADCWYAAFRDHARRIGTRTPRGTHAYVVVVMLPVLLLAACSSGPRKIDMGKEACAHCSMTVTDARFAAELVTTTSKVYVFDAIECLAAFVNESTVPEADIATMWTMRYDAPDEFTDAAKAWYLRSENIKSPMGMHLAAFETEAAYESARAKEGGELLRWTGVRLRVAKEWDDEDED